MDIAPGTDFAKGYRIVEEIGRGGMGTVYKAHQPTLDRDVAIKVLPPSLAAVEGFRERFQREAMTVARLRHTNIVVVYDYGEVDGASYIVSELVEGRTLAAFVGSALSIDFVERALGPIAAALDYAHAQGVLHRDVKPSNVLLARDGRPVLSDFGLVKLLAGSESQSPLQSSPGFMVGTPAYMAPEYASGGTIGPASDRYSLAVMAYELLTGRVPYTADTPLAVLLAQASQPLPSPRSINPAISPAVEGVLLTGLAKEPANRYPTASAFIAALVDASREESPAVAPEPEPVVLVPVPEAATAALTPPETGALRGAGQRRAGTRSPAQGGSKGPTGAAGPLLQGVSSLYTRVAWFLSKVGADLRTPRSRSLAAGVLLAAVLVIVGIVALLSHLGGQHPKLLAVATHSPTTVPATGVPSATPAKGSVTRVVVVPATASPGRTPGPTVVAHVPASTQPPATIVATGPPHHIGPGTWLVTAGMHNARSAQQAVKLKDGRVLIIGGYGASGPMPDAELYDPKNGRWAATGSMHSPREYFSAALLRDGRVLVAGGDDSESALDTAELYDPKNGAWTTTGSMHIPRDQHTATLLLNGMVLVAGGETAGTTPTGLAELYNPATGQWTPTSSMLAAHWDATATRLPDGRVLIAGGGGASAELYNPATGRWTATGSMAMKRYRHTATLLRNNKVLVVGGETAFTAPLDSAELYDPRTGQWTFAGKTMAIHSRHTATLLDNGLVLVTGGSTGTDTQVSLETGTTIAELYNPATNTWLPAGSMHSNRGEHTATLLDNGLVLLAGGYTNQGVVTATAELYKPAGGT